MNKGNAHIQGERRSQDENNPPGVEINRSKLEEVKVHREILLRK